MGHPTKMLAGEPELQRWLELQGFKLQEDNLRHRDNECNWYGYRQSKLAARCCECNYEKPSMQIVVKPSTMQISGAVHSSVEVGLCGESQGVWWSLSAYGLYPNEIPDKLEGVEASLIAAWNALHITEGAAQ